jgi:FlaA1/EpsC-like NDP-sugar epimerase
MRNRILNRFLDAPRPIKRSITLVYDGLAITLAAYLAYGLRLGSASFPIDSPLVACLMATLLISLVTFVRLGLYRAILRYVTQQALLTMVIGILISSIAMATTGFFFHAFLPRSVPVIYIFVALILVGMPRLLFRHLVQMFMPRGDVKVIIYGAGETGHNLAAQLQQSTEFDPVAFVDNNHKLHGSVIRGLTVHSPNAIRNLIRQHGVSRVLLALDSATRQDKVRIVRSLEVLQIQVQTIPPMSDILDGKAKLSELRDIQIEDLLGREPVAPDPVLLRKTVERKTILVTGAGGSIGSELCRQILSLKPQRLILFERNEYNLYKIEQELNLLKLSDQANQVEIIPLMGSINSESHVDIILKQFAVDTLFHAAAYKHVPIVEHNLIEGVKNNLLGTQVLAKCAIKHKVKNFVLISTDKAVRPTNIMGATKRLAEILLQHLAADESSTIFSMVRFGNVLGSSGSVVPLFKKQIAAGGPVTITHKDVIRYFMTISEAAQLVIQSTSIAKTGDLFVLDMGEPIKIVDLVRDMALLSGHSIKDENNPDGDIEIKYVGLRPGEKLFEELLCDNNCEGTEHSRIWRARDEHMAPSAFNHLMSEIARCCEQYKHEELISLIEKSEIGFQPSQNITDAIYVYQQKETKKLVLVTNDQKVEKRN